MPGALSTKVVRDGSANTFSVRVWDETNGSGPYSWVGVPGAPNNDYETVAASQSNQVLGASGAAGDYLSHLLIIPASTSPGAVTIADGSSSPDVQITVFAGGASSVSNLVPFPVFLLIKSATGGWRVTTGSAVSVIAVGEFT